jgi:hypothetical protein
MSTNYTSSPSKHLHGVNVKICEMVKEKQHNKDIQYINVSNSKLGSTVIINQLNGVI